MMAGAHDTITITSPIAHDLDGQFVYGHIETNLLVRTEYRERGDAVTKREKPLLSKPGSHRDHILLGHPHVDEARAKGQLHIFQCAKAQVAGQEDTTGLLPAELLNPLRKFFAHARLRQT